MGTFTRADCLDLEYYCVFIEKLGALVDNSSTTFSKLRDVTFIGDNDTNLHGVSTGVQVLHIFYNLLRS